MTSSYRIHRFVRRSFMAITLIAAVFFISAPLFSQVHYTKGNITFTWDSTLSYGTSYRMNDPDRAIIGLPNRWHEWEEGVYGTAYSVNGDDGNLNYEGIFSSAFKYSTEMELSYKDRFGIFLRGFTFYDYENEKGDRLRTELTEAALDRVGNRTELLDAFVWFNFDMGSIPANVRIGRQVLSWGESTFIQNGINAVNPVDLSALRVPGSELKEAFLPVGMAYASLGLTENLTFEGFYQYEWEQTWIDPPGTYFSTNDFVGAGGERVFISFADFPDLTYHPLSAFMPWLGVDENGMPGYHIMGIPRYGTRYADDDGQYGAAFRYFASNLNDTEFGFYYMNYHSRLPTINGHTGTEAAFMQGMQNAQLSAQLIYQAYGVSPGMVPEIDELVAQTGKVAVIDTYAQSAGYIIAYPEDIELYGLSFNTMLDASGIALQGEVSHRKNTPLQMDDVELLYAALSPVSDGLALTNQIVPASIDENGQVVKQVGFDEDIFGYKLHDVTQVQVTATKAFGPFAGSDMGILVCEAAYSTVDDMPSKDVLRYEGPGTFTCGNPFHSLPGGAHAGKAYETARHFADDASWGYRIAGRMDYNDVFGSFNLSPKFSFTHDVEGVSPGPGGNFLEGRKATSVGIDGSYQNSLAFSLTYTKYYGAGRWNLLNDRDFTSFNIKYSF
ncbi:MAG: hypothetical protein CSA81_12770 [Acidobacteria bacterium]|nr:MAG: hypothetical protein CSA81_12770 [Acidobacteriota bacterium]